MGLELAWPPRALLGAVRVRTLQKRVDDALVSADSLRDVADGHLDARVCQNLTLLELGQTSSSRHHSVAPMRK